MTTELSSGIALGLYLVGVSGTFGARTWLHRRRTGSSGYRGLSGAPGSVQWWGGILFAAALVLAAGAPVLALTGVVVPRAGTPVAIAWAGLVVAAAAFLAVLAAQSGMGTSWRIGVDPAERTGLVTTGMFAVVRNPIFTAMALWLLGLTMLVPTPVSAAALLCLILAVELQVRAVEEPYLRRTHGADYVRYAQRVGRFVPGLGHLGPVPSMTAPNQAPTAHTHTFPKDH